MYGISLFVENFDISVLEQMLIDQKSPQHCKSY